MRKPVERIGYDFMRDLYADYIANGAAAIASLRRDEPRSYFKLVHALYYNEVPEPVSRDPELRESVD